MHFTALMISVAAAATPSPSQQAMYDVLKVRHPAPACASLVSLSDTPADDLLYLTREATQPPWVGMRAAECLLAEHHASPAVQAQARTWVADPGARGFAILTFHALDGLAQADLPLALSLGKTALAGPLADDARTRLAKSSHPQLAALVGPVPSP